MNKKINTNRIIFFFLLAFFTVASPSFASNKPIENLDLTPNARSAILMDADSGLVLYEKNKADKLPPASITKIMTMLLIMESIEQNKITLQEKVRTSEYAASMGGSQIFLEPGEEMTVEDLLKGIAMASGNDASVAMAEKIAGSEQSFVKMMNERAKQLGMNNTHFMNANGLPADQHYTTAEDIAIMSRELMKHKKITLFTGQYQDYLRKDSDKPFWLVNTNKLIRFYAGADGLKTGYTSEAQFCLSATAVRDQLRVIAVVLGEPDTKTRNKEVSSLFDYAFAQFFNFIVVKEGTHLDSLEIQKGEVKHVDLIAKQHFSILMKKGTNTDDVRYEISYMDKIKAPIAKGESIGKLNIFKGNELLKQYNIHAPIDVSEANWWTILKRTVSSVILLK
jgi:D-alanyl-D-alanine carboxypeptidase (penicillin-binding protein 5/6)